MTLPSENITEFRKRINRYAARFKSPKPEITVDCLLEPRDLSTDMPAALAYLEPYGAENPPPVFGLFGVTLEQITPVGGGKHLRLTVSKEGARVQCMRFGCAPERFGYRPGDKLDVVVTLENREYQGNEYLSVCVKELRPGGMDTGNLLSHVALYERARRGEKLSQAQYELLRPSREDFALLYRFLVREKGFSGPLEVLAARLGGLPLCRALL